MKTAGDAPVVHERRPLAFIRAPVAPSLGPADDGGLAARLARAAKEAAAALSDVGTLDARDESQERAVLVAHIKALRWEHSGADGELANIRKEARDVREQSQRLAERKDTLTHTQANRDFSWDAEAELRHEELEYSRLVSMYANDVNQLQEDLTDAAEARTELEAKLARLHIMVNDASEARERVQSEQATLAAALLAAPRPPPPLPKDPRPSSPARHRKPAPCEPFCAAGGPGFSASSSSSCAAPSKPSAAARDDVNKDGEKTQVLASSASAPAIGLAHERCMQARDTLRAQAKVAVAAAAKAAADALAAASRCHSISRAASQPAKQDWCRMRAPTTPQEPQASGDQVRPAWNDSTVVQRARTPPLRLAVASRQQSADTAALAAESSRHAPSAMSSASMSARCSESDGDCKDALDSRRSARSCIVSNCSQDFAEVVQATLGTPHARSDTSSATAAPFGFGGSQRGVEIVSLVTVTSADAPTAPRETLSRTVSTGTLPPTITRIVSGNAASLAKRGNTPCRNVRTTIGSCSQQPPSPVRDTPYRNVRTTIGSQLQQPPFPVRDGWLTPGPPFHRIVSTAGAGYSTPAPRSHTPPIVVTNSPQIVRPQIRSASNSVSAPSLVPVAQQFVVFHQANPDQMSRTRQEAYGAF